MSISLSYVPGLQCICGIPSPSCWPPHFTSAQRAATHKDNPCKMHHAPTPSLRTHARRYCCKRSWCASPRPCCWPPPTSALPPLPDTLWPAPLAATAASQRQATTIPRPQGTTALGQVKAGQQRLVAIFFPVQQTPKDGVLGSSAWVHSHVRVSAELGLGQACRVAVLGGSDFAVFVQQLKEKCYAM